MMIEIREFMKSGGGATSDGQLTTMVRARMLTAPPAQQRSWLREVDLLLDGYATKPQLEAGERLRGVLRHLATEVADRA